MGKTSKNLEQNYSYISFSSAIGLLSIIILMLVISPTHAAQPAYSLKFAGEFLNANDELVSRYRVRCRKHDEDRFIQRKADNQQYCAYGQSSMCFYNRVEAANAACELSTARVSILEGRLDLRAVANEASNSEVATAAPASAALQQSSIAEQEKLMDELFALEEQRLAIRERQLELRKRELQLRSRQQQVIAN